METVAARPKEEIAVDGNSPWKFLSGIRCATQMGGFKTIELSIKMILLCWRNGENLLPRFLKTHYRLKLVAILTLCGRKGKLNREVKRRFNTQLGKINSNGFVTECHFIGLCLKNRKKKLPSFFFKLAALPQSQIEVHTCTKLSKMVIKRENIPCFN